MSGLGNHERAKECWHDSCRLTHLYFMAMNRPLKNDVDFHPLEVESSIATMTFLGMLAGAYIWGMFR